MKMIKGWEKLSKQLEELSKVDKQKTLLAGAYKLQALSQKSDDLPVDTGFLRSSHSSQTNSEGAELVVSAEYAVFQHEGTKFIKGREWITKTFDNKTQEIVEAIRKSAQSWIRGVK